VTTQRKVDKRTRAIARRDTIDANDVNARRDARDDTLGDDAIAFTRARRRRGARQGTKQSV
jgi:hypothetical protein